MTLMVSGPGLHPRPGLPLSSSFFGFALRWGGLGFVSHLTKRLAQVSLSSPPTFG